MEVKEGKWGRERERKKLLQTYTAFGSHRWSDLAMHTVLTTVAPTGELEILSCHIPHDLIVSFLDRLLVYIVRKHKETHTQKAICVCQKSEKKYSTHTSYQPGVSELLASYS